MKAIAATILFLAIAGCVTQKDVGYLYRAGYAQGYADGINLAKEAGADIGEIDNQERFFSDFRKASAIIYGEPQEFDIRDH